MSKIEIEVVVLSDADKRNLTEIEFVRYPFKDRLRDGLKKGGMFWGAAVLSVFVPVAHFVLVPLFLLLGVLSLYKQLQFPQVIKSGEFKCPNCSEKIPLESLSFHWPIRKDCPKCTVMLLARPCGPVS
jgi:hypothetical protein